MIGVLLMGYGSPASLEDVEAYCTHIRGGAPQPAEVRALRKKYRRIGGSPLLGITKKQASALGRTLGSADYKVYVGMKHWHPFISETVGQMAADGLRSIVALPLAPHYSEVSIGGYVKAVREALEDGGLDVSLVKSWNDHPLFLRAVEEKLRKAMSSIPEGGGDVPVIFTAHSLPKRLMPEGDPYESELKETCEALGRRLGLEWSLAYQSRGREGEWLGPHAREVVERLSREGRKNVLVCPVGFVSDHLEILYDIDIDLREYAEARGLEMKRTESLNDSLVFINALAAIVREAEAKGFIAAGEGIGHDNLRA